LYRCEIESNRRSSKRKANDVERKKKKRQDEVLDYSWCRCDRVGETVNNTDGVKHQNRGNNVAFVRFNEAVLLDTCRGLNVYSCLCGVFAFLTAFGPQ